MTANYLGAGLALIVATSCMGLAAGPAVAAGGRGSAGGPESIHAVAAENQYADVIRQIGGRYVQVAAILSNPNSDPHSFEASPAVAREIADASLVVQNGAGYDAFIDNLEAATRKSGREVLNVQKLLGLPARIADPHLWYQPAAMPAVAKAIANYLSRALPSHAGYFETNLLIFDGGLQPWLTALADFKSAHPNTPVATTEPVADYMLEAAGAAILTPFALQADVMNGVDPAPQAVTIESELLTQHRVKVLVYNRQVTDALTQSFVALARQNHVPVVGVSETMPTPGYTYQSWMLTEIEAIASAVATPGR